MSQFSDSYHLYDTRDGARAFLRAGGRVGAIYGSNPRCTSFVVSDTDYAVDAIAAAAKRPIIFFSFAEDHGLAMNFYVDGKEIGSYSMEWLGFDEEGSERQVPPKWNEATAKALVAAKVLTPTDLKRWRELTKSIDFDDLDPEAVAEDVAKIFGLASYEWISSQYLAAAIESGDLDGAELIDPSKAPTPKKKPAAPKKKRVVLKTKKKKEAAVKPQAKRAVTRGR